MIDIHCHVLFSADDGAEDLEMSIEMCKVAAEDGIRGIIATPHFIVGEKNEKEINRKVKQLNEALYAENIPIIIYPGNELFIDYGMASKIKNGECFTLNNSRYVLVEFPMLEIPRYSQDALYELQIKRYIPIIAHPERNRVFKERPELLVDFVSDGCLVQINSGSISGLFGEDIKEVSHNFLKHNLVHFVASDAHSCGRRRPAMAASKRVVIDMLGKDRATELYHSNPHKVIADESIDVVEPVPFRKKSFWRRRMT